MRKMRLLTTDQSGAILVSILLVFPFLILITLHYMSLGTSIFRVAANDQSQTYAQLAADAGLDLSLQEVNIDSAWAGTDSEVTLHNEPSVRTTYATTVTSNGPEEKTITSTGRTYKPAANTTPVSTVTLVTELRPVNSGNFSVVTGVGGLYMQNSAKVLGGDVFINGELQMQNSAQIGLESNPVTVNVAHQNCPDPPDASYPAACGPSDGEPITITNSAHIYGTVNANNQLDGNGMDDPGLVSSSGVVPKPLPEHDRNAQKANVTTTTSDNYYLNCDKGTRTWPGRLKIEGDVTIRQSCTVKVEGDVWITGRLTMQNSARMIVSDTIALGGQNTVDAGRPTIMIDGSAGFAMQNSAKVEANSNDVGTKFITYWSRASCSPDCADVTGVDLANTRGDRTIYLQNSASAPDSIVYARWSQAELGNGGGIGAVIGQTVRLSNTATITFSTSMGAGTSYWVIDSYRRQFN